MPGRTSPLDVQEQILRETPEYRQRMTWRVCVLLWEVRSQLSCLVLPGCHSVIPSLSHLTTVISKKWKRVDLSREGRCRSQNRKWLEFGVSTLSLPNPQPKALFFNFHLFIFCFLFFETRFCYPVDL